MLLKRKLSSKSWVMETIVEAVCCHRGGDSLGLACGFNSATNRLVFSFNFASDLPRFRRDFRHDCATIGSRSGVDRGVRASSITGRSMRGESPPILRHNLLDRGSIAPRSWSSFMMFNRRLIALSLDGRSRLSDPVRRNRDVNQPSDDLMRVPCQPSDRDRLSMKISRPIAINSKPFLEFSTWWIW